MYYETCIIDNNLMCLFYKLPYQVEVVKFVNLNQKWIVQRRLEKYNLHLLKWKVENDIYIYQTRKNYLYTNNY